MLKKMAGGDAAPKKRAGGEDSERPTKKHKTNPLVVFCPIDYGPPIGFVKAQTPPATTAAASSSAASSSSASQAAQVPKKEKTAEKATKAERLAARKAFDAEREKEFIASRAKRQSEEALVAEGKRVDQILFARVAAGEDVVKVVGDLKAQRIAKSQASSESNAKAEEKKSGEDIA